MKKINSIFWAAVITGAVFIACSGGKHEGHEQGNAEAPTDEKAGAAKVSVMDEIVIFENVDASVKNQINQFLTDYDALNKALIEDNADEARKAAGTFSATVSKFDMSKLVGDQMDYYHMQSAKLNAGLKGITESSDIEEIRMELSPVSESMYAMVKAYQANNNELYYQFCPMARHGEGANWLSQTKEIVNPYMGQRMLKCGKTEEVIAVK